MQNTKRSVSVVTSSLKRTLASGQKRNFSSGIVNNVVNTEKWAAQLNASLKDVDPELFDIIEHEKNRQYKGLQLIPSEVNIF